MRATTADVRNAQFAAVKHASMADTHRGQGAMWRRTDRVNTVVGHKKHTHIQKNKTKHWKFKRVKNERNPGKSWLIS